MNTLLNAKVISPGFLLAIISFVAATVAAAEEEKRVELLVKLRRDPPVADPGAVHAAVGATLIRSFQAVGWDLVRLPEGMSVAAGLARYRARPEIVAVEPNGQIYLQPPPPPVESGPSEPSEAGLSATSTGAAVTPNDPRWSSQWNLRKIGMPEAWAVSTGSSNVVVAVLDSGVDYTHEDLRDNMWRNPGESGLDQSGKDKSSNGMDDDGNGYIDDVHGIDTFDNDGDPMDPGIVSSAGAETNYHGTGCAAIIGAIGNNSNGISGICWSAQIMAVRLPLNAGTRPVRKSALVEGFDYVIQQRRRGVNVRVMNNSWGGLGQSAAVMDAINVAGTEGILSFFAAMNEALSTDIQWGFPCAADSPFSLSVANVDSSDVLAPRSNFGKSTVDLAAPGRLIYTLSGNNGHRAEFSGTSAACPHVAGAAALLLSVYPEATPMQLKAALIQSADPVSSLRGRVVSNGRLNVGRALQVITNSSLPPIVVSAFPGSPQTRTNSIVEIYFNTQMERASVESALQFTPPITGSFEWSDTDRILRLRPDAPLTETNYTARILGTARDLGARTLDGDFDRSSEGSPADDFVWSFRFAPRNDAFASATLLTGLQGALRDNNTNSSLDEDERSPVEENRWASGPSLWYRWTAPTNGWMTFDASSNSSIDTIVTIYTGETLGALAEVGRGDDFGTRKGGRISLPVHANTNYFVRLGGTWPASTLDTVIGSFILAWYSTPAPSFTATQFNPKTALPGAKITLFGTNFTGATEVLFNDARAEFTPGLTNNSDLRITAVVPPDATDGPITIRTPHGDVMGSSNFVVLPPRLAVALGALDRKAQAEIFWPATTPAIALEASESLLPGEWVRIDTGLERANGRTVFRPSATDPRRYFRLRKAP